MKNKLNIQRHFFVGDEWLYFKIYTGANYSELILNQLIKPLCSQYKQDGIIDKWFFIRYSDPKYHLRVRFHLLNNGDYSKIIDSLIPKLRHYCDDDVIFKVQIETYSRELERYGSNIIHVVEELFFYDSEMVVSVINLLKLYADEVHLRWLICLKSIDTLLDLFNFTIYDKNRLLKVLSDGFSKEFSLNKKEKKKLNLKYRKYRSLIESFMLHPEKQGLFSQEMIHIWNNRKNNSKKIINKILKIYSNDPSKIDVFLGSIIHMHLNRVFVSKNRLNEMVCYFFLSRYYSSEVAKKKHEK